MLDVVASADREVERAGLGADRHLVFDVADDFEPVVAGERDMELHLFAGFDFAARWR